jgi:hypothetical protein
MSGGEANGAGAACALVRADALRRREAYAAFRRVRARLGAAALRSSALAKGRFFRLCWSASIKFVTRSRLGISGATTSLPSTFTSMTRRRTSV